MGARIDFWKSEFNRSRFESEYMKAKKKYPLVKVVWQTMALNQNNESVSVEGIVRLIIEDQDGRRIHETKPKYNFRYLIHLEGEGAADHFAGALAHGLAPYIEKGVLDDDAVKVELVTYGQEFGYFSIRFKDGTSVTLGDGKGMIPGSYWD